MKLTQSRQLLSFISSLGLEIDGTVRTPYFSDLLSYESKFYTPELVSSKLGLDMAGILKAGTTFNAKSGNQTNEIISLARLLDLKNTNPLAYKLLQLITLEVFSLVAVIEIAPTSANEYNLDDANRLHNNIMYLNEYLGNEYAYNGKNTRTLEQSVVAYRLVRKLKELDKDSAYMYKVISGNTLGGGNSAL